MKYSPTGRLITSEPLKGSVFQMGRQQIVDLRGEIFGYELLYRASTDNYVNVMDGDLATLTVFLNTFSLAGLNSMVGSRKASFNVTRNFLIGRYPIPVSPDRIILEIQKDFDFDATLIRSLKELSAQGYQLALDGVISRQEIQPVAEVVHYVKLNIAELEPIVLPRMVKELKEKNIRPIAERVETREEYNQCVRAGFDLFQGFFIRRPEVVQGRNIHSSRAVILKILAALKNPNVRIEELESAFASDITISYRLLKLVNSGYYHSARVLISSIRQAFLKIGLDRLKNWLNLLLEANSSNEMQSLSFRALIRAKTAAALAKEMQVLHPDTCFLAGLFSVLDTAMELPMKEAIEGLSLTDEIETALTSGQGQLGKLLQIMLWAEQENWDAITNANLDAEKIKRLYLESATWAEQYY